MTIKSFPYGIPFSSSFALTASHAINVGDFSTATASLAEFVTGFTGPRGPDGITIDNGGQFTTPQSQTIQFVGSTHNPVGIPTFPSHVPGDLIILYGETTQSFAPVLSSSATLTGWREVSSTTSPARILAVKYASSSIETFPSFSNGQNTINNMVLVYRNVDSIGFSAGSATGNSVPTMLFAGAEAVAFTPNRNHWILIFQISSNFVNSLTPAQTPRSGFTNRLIGYSGSVAFPNSRLYAVHDSNMVTSSIAPGGTIAVNSNTSYNSFTHVLRARLDYSQFQP